MTGYFRQIHTSIWRDDWFLDLAPLEKIIFINLFSNDQASLSGLYRANPKVIAFETGTDTQFVLDTLEKFERDGKVFYEDGLIWVVSMRRYHPGGPKTEIKVKNDIDRIPDCPLKRKYLDYYAEKDAVSDSGDTVPDPGNTVPPDNDALSIPYEYPIDTIPLKTESKIDQKTEKEVELTDSAPQAAQSSHSPPVESEVIELFKTTWGVKRPNAAQISILREIEKYPIKYIREYVEWARVENMTFGHAVNSSRKALAGWGKRHISPNGSKPSRGGLAPVKMTEEDRRQRYGGWGG